MKKYIISTVDFRGFAFAGLSNGQTVDNTDYTFEEYKERHNDPSLILLSEEEFLEKREEYILSQITPFQETNEKNYEIQVRTNIIQKQYVDRYIQLFYVGQHNSLGLYYVYCRYIDKYFVAKKSIKHHSELELIDEITTLANYEAGGKYIFYQNRVVEAIERTMFEVKAKDYNEALEFVRSFKDAKLPIYSHKRIKPVNVGFVVERTTTRTVEENAGYSSIEIKNKDFIPVAGNGI